MVNMLDIDNVRVLTCHSISIYFVCVIWTHSLPFCILSPIICISFGIWFVILHFCISINANHIGMVKLMMWTCL